MKTVCIYHSIDLDGWMSAAIVKHWWKTNNNDKIEPLKFKDEEKDTLISVNNTLDFIGYNYGQPIPDLSEYDKVIMCDISFPKEEMLNLFNRLDDNFIWNDHHISAIKDCKGYVCPLGRQLTNYAACELTWQYFFPNEPMPEIVRLLGRYDCFGHKTKRFDFDINGYNKAKEYLIEINKLQEFENNNTSTDGFSLVHYANDVALKLSEEQKVLEFQYGARQLIDNYEKAYKWLVESLKPTSGIVEDIQYNGASIYQYLYTDAKQTYKNGFEINFTYVPVINAGAVVKNFICINRERFNPINFGINYHADGYDGCACFHYDGVAKLWRFSLYNDNGTVDCSIIAKQFGGGGHKGATGFTVNMYNFLEIIK